LIHSSWKAFFTHVFIGIWFNESISRRKRSFVPSCEKAKKKSHKEHEENKEPEKNIPLSSNNEIISKLRKTKKLFQRRKSWKIATNDR
jgi:hypothetical protein